MSQLRFHPTALIGRTGTNVIGPRIYDEDALCAYIEQLAGAIVDREPANHNDEWVITLPKQANHFVSSGVGLKRGRKDAYHPPVIVEGEAMRFLKRDYEISTNKVVIVVVTRETHLARLAKLGARKATLHPDHTHVVEELRPHVQSLNYNGWAPTPNQFMQKVPQLRSDVGNALALRLGEEALELLRFWNYHHPVAD